MFRCCWFASLAGCLNRLADWLTSWLAWVIDWLNGLVDWFAGWMVWLTGCSSKWLVEWLVAGRLVTGCLDEWIDAGLIERLNGWSGWLTEMLNDWLAWMVCRIGGLCWLGLWLVNGWIAGLTDRLTALVHWMAGVEWVIEWRIEPRLTIYYVINEGAIYRYLDMRDAETLFSCSLRAAAWLEQRRQCGLYTPGNRIQRFFGPLQGQGRRNLCHLQPNRLRWRLPGQAWGAAARRQEAFRPCHLVVFFEQWLQETFGRRTAIWLRTWRSRLLQQPDLFDTSPDEGHDDRR